MGRLSRDRHFRHQFGLVSEDVERMFTEQKGICPICKKTMILFTKKGESWKTGGSKAVVDHSHKLKWSRDKAARRLGVRRLVCNNCNLGLGLFGDDIETLVNAVVYLKSFEEKSE